MRIAPFGVVLSIMIASFCFIPSSSAAFTEGWQAPTLLQSITDYAQAETIGMDDRGNAIVVWEQPMANTTTDAIWAIRYDSALGWGTAERILDAPFWCGYTTMAMSANGDALAAWTAEVSPGVSGIYCRLFDPTVGWNSTTLLYTSSSLGDIAASMDPEGNAVVVWSTLGPLVACRYDVDTGWEGAVTISSSGGSWPMVDFDDAGNAMAMWNDFDTEQVKAARYTMGVGWSLPMIVSGSVGGYWANMDVNESGYVLAGWFKHNGTAWEMFSNMYTPSVGWGTVEKIGPVANGWHPFGIEIASGWEGEFFTLWQQSESQAGGVQSVWSMRWMEDTGWDTPVKISVGEPTNPYGLYPRLAANPKGEAFALWIQGNDTYADLISGKYDPGVGWGAPEEIDAPTEDSVLIANLACDPNGNAAAVWRQKDGSDYLEWGSVYRVLVGPELTINEPLEGTVVYEPTVVVRGVTDPNASLVVNGLMVAVETNGSFRINIALVNGTNEIWARATGSDGGTTEVLVNVTYIDPITQLIQGIDALTAQLGTVWNQLNTTMDELTAVQQELAATQAQLDDTSALVASLEDQLVQAWSELNESKTQITALDFQILELSQQLNVTNDDLEVARAEVQQLRSELDTTTDTITSLETQLQIVRTSLDEVSNDLDDTNDEIAAMILLTYLLLGLIVVLFVIVAVVVMMYLRLKNTVGGGEKT